RVLFDQHRHGTSRHTGPQKYTLDALACERVFQRNGIQGIRGRAHTDLVQCAAIIQHVISLARGGTDTNDVEDIFHPETAGKFFNRGHRSTSAELMVWVAPNFLAASSDAALTSTEMILQAQANTAPDTALSPTPPAPIITTSSPARTLAAFSTAPVPVITPQPMTAAWANGISFGNLTSIFSCTS